MNNIKKVSFLKRKSPTTILGLSLEGSRMEGVVLRRSNGSLQILRRFAATLSLDLLTGDAELVGREILNHLQAAGVRERTCVVALPLKWAMAVHTEIPKLSDADVPAFLQIEAERGFPTDVATLQVVTSRVTGASGTQHATFIGIPRGHVERLDQVLHAAKLKPVSFSLGITALQPPKGDAGVLSLFVADHQIGLQVTCGGGVAALRALEGVMEAEGGARALHADLVARESRITMGQLPADLRDSVKLVRIFGPRDEAEKLADEIKPRFEPSGMRVELISVYPPREFLKTLPSDTAVSGALSLAARELTGEREGFEFLPPRVSKWQKMTSRYAPGKLRKVAAAAALVVLIVVGMFLYQQVQLSRLNKEWDGMSKQVAQIKATQDNIQAYRSWYNRTFPCLTLLKQLTFAFPQNGSVTAKNLEIRDMNSVSCSGTADSYTALAKIVGLLSTNSNVQNVTPQTRGKSPMQFTLNYKVNVPGGANESR